MGSFQCTCPDGTTLPLGQTCVGEQSTIYGETVVYKTALCACVKWVDAFVMSLPFRLASNSDFTSLACNICGDSYSKDMFVNFAASPGMVTTNHVSSNSILISWEAPIMLQPDEDLENYYLSCSSGGTTEVQMSLDSDTISYNVTNLTPDTTYTCCVMAITTDGLSPNVCIKNSTLEDGKYNAFTILSALCGHLPTVVDLHGISQ